MFRIFHSPKSVSEIRTHVGGSPSTVSIPYKPHEVQHHPCGPASSMWPGISEAGLGLVQVSECPQWSIVGKGLFRIFHSPQVRFGDTDPRGGDSAPTWPGISEAGFGLVQVSESPDSGNSREGLVQDFSQPRSPSRRYGPTWWRFGTHVARHLRGRFRAGSGF